LFVGRAPDLKHPPPGLPPLRVMEETLIEATDACAKNEDEKPAHERANDLYENNCLAAAFVMNV